MIISLKNSLPWQQYIIKVEKMKVLFCHDGPLRRDECNNYYGISHNDEMFRRYFSIADELNVLIRVVDEPKDICVKNYSLITVFPFRVIQCPSLSSYFGLLKNYKKAKRIIKNAVLEADYIVIRLPSVIGSIAATIAKNEKRPYLVEMVSCPWDAYWNYGLSGKIVAPFMYLITKKLVSEAPYAIYVTNDFLQRRYPCKGIIESCSNVSLPAPDDTILEKRLEKIRNKKNDERIIIGTIAAVDVKYKGQQYVIEALGKLKKSGYCNYDYQLVGGGNQDYLKRIAEKHGVSDQVKFLGPIPHCKVFEWLDSIDIYVQPSRQEGLPRALLEAMSRGCPALGARTGGIPELLDSDYIYSYKGKYIDNIYRIIIMFTKERMLAQAKRNFSISRIYNKESIELRRRKFFRAFTESKQR